ncbi:flavodoxin [Teredinibacter turnerae]|uniref:flavodoxin n=1 Tax=Teredinibacter turnerae TaxID=2426 RepID=UPI00037E7AD8|nr:flavodoxin [Teredinibacter turnerae]
MDKIGFFFGTETGTTRLVAKKLYKLIGDERIAKPVNVNRITAEEFLQYDAYILGTPSYGVGEIPGLAAGCLEKNWAEFLSQLGSPDLSGKRIAMFGLGAQERYAERFASSLKALHDVFAGLGAEMIGQWQNEGYVFENSAALVNDKFVGLVIDQRTQSMFTDERLKAWIADVLPALEAKLTDTV